MLGSVLGKPQGRSWPSDDAEIRWGIGATIGCFFGAQLLAVLWASVWIGVLYGADEVPPLAERALWTLPVLSLGLWLGYLVGPVVVNRLTGSGPMVDFDLRAPAAQLGLGAVLGIGAQLLVLPALYWVLLQFVSGDPSETAETLVGRADGGLDVVLLVLSVVILAPVAEEWFYRGMLLSALVRRAGPVVGATTSSAVFALVHQELILMPGLFVFALLLAWLTVRTGRLGVAVAAHMAFNATTVILLLA